MTLPNSGQISSTDIQSEFNQTGEFNIANYYRGGGVVPATSGSGTGVAEIQGARLDGFGSNTFTENQDETVTISVDPNFNSGPALNTVTLIRNTNNPNTQSASSTLVQVIGDFVSLFTTGQSYSFFSNGSNAFVLRSVFLSGGNTFLGLPTSTTIGTYNNGNELAANTNIYSVAANGPASYRFVLDTTGDTFPIDTPVMTNTGTLTLDTRVTSGGLTDDSWDLRTNSSSTATSINYSTWAGWTTTWLWIDATGGDSAPAAAVQDADQLTITSGTATATFTVSNGSSRGSGDIAVRIGTIISQSGTPLTSGALTITATALTHPIQGTFPANANATTALTSLRTAILNEWQDNGITVTTPTASSYGMPSNTANDYWGSAGGTTEAAADGSTPTGDTGVQLVSGRANIFWLGTNPLSPAGLGGDTEANVTFTDGTWTDPDGIVYTWPTDSGSVFFGSVVYPVRRSTPALASSATFDFTDATIGTVDSYSSTWTVNSNFESATSSGTTKEEYIAAELAALQAIALVDSRITVTRSGDIITLSSTSILNVSWFIPEEWTVNPVVTVVTPTEDARTVDPVIDRFFAFNIGRSATVSIVIDTNQTNDISQELTITRNDGTDTEPTITALHGTTASGTASSYTLTDYAGTEVAALTATSGESPTSIVNRLVTAVDANTETPIDFRGGTIVNSATDVVLTLTAQSVGSLNPGEPSTARWNLNINHNGGNGSITSIAGIVQATRGRDPLTNINAGVPDGTTNNTQIGFHNFYGATFGDN